jgi:eukaryotic-like serine/threonine-protein kinase
MATPADKSAQNPAGGGPARMPAPPSVNDDPMRATLVMDPPEFTGAVPVLPAVGSPAAGIPKPPPAAKAAARPVDPTVVRTGGEVGPGTILGKYRLVRQVSADERGVIFEAVHISIGRSFALKTMNPLFATVPKAVARFMREASLASRLSHPHVVAWTDFGTENGVMYLVMEWLSGQSLADLLARERNSLSPEVMADIMLAVCAGVFAAHEAGVVHRDLRPENIVLSQSSLGEIVPKVVNFGWSRMMNDDPTTFGANNADLALDSLQYFSPEHLGNDPVDAASDQYSLGVILYEALTGRRPNSAENVGEVIRNISQGTAPRPRLFRPDLSDEFEAIIIRATATKPSERFESVAALGRALLPFASTKRQLIWSDYYQRRGGGSGAIANLPSIVPGLGTSSGPGNTEPLELRKPAATPAPPARGTPAPPARVTPASPARATPAQAPSGRRELPSAAPSRVERAVPFAKQRRPTRQRRGPRLFTRLGLLAVVGAAAAGVFLVRRDPRLREYMPPKLREVLEAAGARAPSADPPKVDVTRAALPAFAPETGRSREVPAEAAPEPPPPKPAPPRERAERPAPKAATAARVAKRAKAASRHEGRMAPAAQAPSAPYGAAAVPAPIPTPPAGYYPPAGNVPSATGGYPPAGNPPPATGGYPPVGGQPTAAPPPAGAYGYPTAPVQQPGAYRPPQPAPPPPTQAPAYYPPPQGPPQGVPAPGYGTYPPPSAPAAPR